MFKRLVFSRLPQHDAATRVGLYPELWIRVQRVQEIPNGATFRHRLRVADNPGWHYYQNARRDAIFDRVWGRKLRADAGDRRERTEEFYVADDDIRFGLDVEYLQCSGV